MQQHQAIMHSELDLANKRVADTIYGKRAMNDRPCTALVNRQLLTMGPQSCFSPRQSDPPVMTFKTILLLCSSITITNQRSSESLISSESPKLNRSLVVYYPSSIPGRALCRSPAGALHYPALKDEFYDCISAFSRAEP